MRRLPTNRGAIINFYSTCWGMCGGSFSTTAMTDNNGNLQRQEVYIPDNEGNTSNHQLSEDFDYASLNRLQRVHDGTTWQQQYVYDRFGNRTVDQTNTFGSGIPKPNFAVEPSNNRLGVPSGQSGTMSYDNAGNLTTDTYSASAVSRAYDAENRMTSETQSGSYVAGSYGYDGDGRRVKRTINTTETWQVYGLGGELLAEYAANAAAVNPQKEYGYRNGQLLITADAPARTNYALSSNGATASASTTQSSSYPASNVNNGERAGAGSTTGGVFNGWIGSSATFTQWLQIDFGQTRSLNEIDVLGVQDNYTSPSAPTLSMAYTLYGLSGYDVQYWNGSAWVTVSGGSITSNDKVWRQITFAAISTTKIKVLTNASSDSNSRLTELEAWGETTPAVNVALSSNGATASASTTQSSSYPASNVNNGERAGGSSTTGGVFNGWISSSAALTQWLQIDFGQTRSISEIDVFGVQDNYTSPSAPTLSMTYTLYGMSGYEVQYWNGSAWVTVSGGSISGSNTVWKKINFSAISTTKIRVLTNASPDNFSRLTEVEAWTAPTTPSVHWLVTDQLGTPRMIFDQSGSLATTSRHDYLPFGEEIFAGTAGRTTALGYTNNDEARQKFTQKERDIETGLDFFGARYFASTQGRFTSPDPFSIIQMRQSAPNDEKTHTAFMQFIGDPRRWNRFAYAVNSPLVFTDKTGLDIMIIENGPTKGNPVGHTAIAITGRGVYSMGNAERRDTRDSKNNILGGGVKDYLIRELPRRDTTITIIKTTPEQDAAAAASMESQAASKPMLGKANIFSDNCTTRVQEALDAAGISRAPQNFESVPGSAGARVIQNGNSPTSIDIPQNSNLTEADRQAIQQFEPARNTSPIAAPGTPGGTPVVTMPAETQRRKRPEDE